MKKVTIITTIFSILISIITYFFIKEKNNIIEKITRATALHNSNNVKYKKIRDNLLFNYNNSKNYYEYIDLDRTQYYDVTTCMQRYLKNIMFDKSGNCKRKIIDILVKEYGESGILLAIIGDTIEISNSDIYLKPTYINDLITNANIKNTLMESLLISFIDRYRDPVKLKALYDSNKDYFFNFITKSIYDKIYKKQINSLIASYDKIHNNKSKEVFYQDIYTKANKLNQHSKYWVYTFWRRREIEKNDQVLYAILSDIRAYYTWDCIGPNGVITCPD